MTRLFVLGSINLDLVGRCETLPVAGETVLGSDYAEHPGGKGANQALAAARLGGEVSMIGRVGADSNAEAALALLKEGGVDLSHVREDAAAKTGVALIGVSTAGENQIIVAPGANAQVSPADLPETIDGALLAQLEVPIETVAEAAQRCTGLVAVNLAPAASVPDALLARADLLIVNETEADFYGRETLFAAAKQVALTLGGAGAELYENGTKIAAAAPPAVDVIDTTGAGDCFCGALVVALTEGLPAQQALNFAVATSALAVTKEGAQPSLPIRAEVGSLL